MDISFDRRNVSQCLQQRFTLPTYQREYKWEVKHLHELLTDVQETFFANYRPEHGRAEVAKYGSYFLGTIITTPSNDGSRAIVDGQQRLTTLALIVAHFCRVAKRRPDLNISDISPLLRRRVFGKNEFNINFEEPRRQLFEYMMDYEGQTDNDAPSLDEVVDSIPNLDNGSRRLYELYCHIGDFITDEIGEKLVPFFVDYLTQCVQLFEIGVPGEQDGHKVYVTMNDRGLKLGPIDLLKGFFLSNIRENAANVEAHEAWNDCVRRLKAIGQDEDSSFFKTWLRAQYAKTIRGKQRGAAPEDFEIVGDSYHRWVVDNRDRLGLVNADDFYNLLTTTIPTYVGHYIALKKSEEVFNPSYPHVFFNGARDFTLQSMATLAAISPSDTQADVARKIRLVSYYLDYFSVHRAVNGQDNTYNNVRDPIFQLVNAMRGKPVQELAVLLAEEMSKLPGRPIGVDGIRYYYWRQQDLLHVLARFGHFLEEAVEATNKVGFAGYIFRAKGNKTFDIEHVLSTQAEASFKELGKLNDFDDIAEYREARNQFGALILLSRGRNRSLQAASYLTKLPVYSTECILAQMLGQAYYENNPQVKARLAEIGLDIGPVEHFNKAAIGRRTEIYNQIAQRIWNVEELFRSIA
jgi:hypothetical protein